MLDTLDAAAVRDWCAAGLQRLRQHREEIDELNVYPVPDGDTGTNLVLTVAAAGEAIAGAPDGPDALASVMRALARGALLGARGNSGVILSQIFAGMAEVLAEATGAGGRAFAAATDRAASSARQAVANPVEGTMLTVVRAAADAALTADTDDLAAAVTAAAKAAREALARTPQQLPALARAGVVDAGGRGLVVLLDALVEVVTGSAPEQPARAGATPVGPRRVAVEAMRESGSDEYAYEVQYLLDAPDEAVDRLREVLGGIGDSLVIVGTEGPTADQRTWNVHVHVNDVGAALEAGVEAGRPYRISVTRFVDQMPAGAPTPEAAAGGRPDAGGTAAGGRPDAGASPRDGARAGPVLGR